jgi:hypothetical protein
VGAQAAVALTCITRHSKSNLALSTGSSVDPSANAAEKATHSKEGDKQFF